MRTSFMRFVLFAAVAFALTACEKEIYNENGMSSDGTTADGAVPEGYFRATFFPEQEGDASTRAALNHEYSKAIQSLICILYKEEADGTFSYLEEQPVLEYSGPAASEGQEIQPKEYLWPLHENVTFVLPKGNQYRAVFVGNSDKNLFKGQDTQVLTDYKNGKYSEARLCMPDGGPVVFNAYNMFHLCTVDFSAEDFAEGATPPHVLMQRVVSNNIYGRRMINTEEDVNDVVNVLVDEIVTNDNLLATTLETLLIENLKANLGDWISENKSLNILDPNNAIARTLEGLINVAGGLDEFVSLLTTGIDDENPGILGALLDEIRNILLDRLTEQLENAILGSTEESLLGLGYVLSPWEHVHSVDITYTSLPKNINFDRECTSLEKNGGSYNYVLGDMTIEKPGKTPKDDVKKETYRTFNVITFCGEQNVDKITVNSEGLVGSLLDALDNGLLDGLLINIKDATPPLIYEAESNREYRTFYDLVDLALNKMDVAVGENDNNSHEGMDVVELKIDLEGAIDLSKILGAILGRLGEFLGGVLDVVLGIVTDILDNIIGNNGIKIYLPTLLDINSISFSGQWGDTVISHSDETIPHKNQ